MIVLSDSVDFQTSLSTMDGMQLGRGWVDSAFVTDRSKDECVLEDVHILLWEKKLSAISPAIELLKAVQAQNGSFLVIAEDIDSDALDNLKINHARGLLKSCAVRIPGHPLHRRGTLADIAAMIGAVPITQDLDMDIKDVKLEHLGRAGRVVVSKDSTLIIDGGGASEDIAARTKELRSLVEKSSGNERDLLQQRLASLSGGMVVVRVGAFTENEAAELKYRVEDAMHAVQAASEEGVLPGGGIALYRAKDKIDVESFLDKDEHEGARIVWDACLIPLATILSNAGLSYFEIEHRLGKFYYCGYNARTNEYEDFSITGILDPAKVVRMALQNAASIATLLLTSQVCVTEKRPSEATMALAALGAK